MTALAVTTPFAIAAAPEPVEINVLVPLTGSVALIGQSASKALAILQDEINRSGGIGGRPRVQLARKSSHVSRR